jgi:hypothetical protein
VEQFRKQAKALVRAHRAGGADAVARARAVLGERDRFVLADAQHVVAREQGHRTWADLKREEETRADWEVDTGLVYGAGEPVRVHVKRRLHRYLLDDRGAAARIAGRPLGWQEVAHEVVVGRFWLNVDRRGKVFVPAVAPASLEEITTRVGEASVALYAALLDLST